MAWGDVDRKERRGSLSGRFVSFEDGVTIRMRILDEEPHTVRVHKVSQNVKKGDKVEEVFRSIPATDNPDDNYILKNAPNGRYPDVMQFNMRAAVYEKDDKGKDLESYSIQILQGGPAIFKPLQELYTQNGHLNQFDITIVRKGKSRDTEYTVSAAPFSKKIDLNAAMTKLMQDEAIADWSNVFPSVNADDQIKAIKDAGFDITFDPAAALASGMTLEQAAAVTFTMGKYKGKTVGELAVIDAGYVEWAGKNVTSNDQLAAACRVATGSLSQVAASASAVPAALPAAKAVKETPKTETAKENPKKREALLDEISSRFDVDPRFEDIDVMVSVVKKHSGGKTKLKDLTITQLEALKKDIEG